MALEKHGPNGWASEFPTYESRQSVTTESPIELRMLRALACASWPGSGTSGGFEHEQHLVPVGRYASALFSDVLLSLDVRLEALRPRINIQSQVKIGRFRVDILVECSPTIISEKPVKMVVECDGAAYHSTPAQTNNDAARDAALWRMGYSVCRFTGREINRNAAECANRVITAIINRHLEMGR